jgi:hypothetical protein
MAALHDAAAHLRRASRGAYHILRARSDVAVRVWFNCRLRQGLPRHHVPWFPEEAITFRLFTTPNQLAEAISHPNPQQRDAAMAAMVNIRHICDTLTRHLGGTEFLADNEDRIFYIGDLSSFDLDLACLRVLLQIDDDTVAPTDEIGANRSPNHLDRRLSDLAIRNLKGWYQQDYAIYRWCQTYRQRVWSALSAG